MKYKKLQKLSILTVIGFFMVFLGITVLMTVKNTSDLKEILTESVKSQLISTSIAAREIIDVDKFESYNSTSDTEKDEAAYSHTLENLRAIKDKVGATYIYALKQRHGKYYFVFDTDTEEDTRFDEYEISPVHEAAFLGKDSAGILNVVDEYGSFNTGAVPIWKNDRVIGVISTDIEDSLIRKSDKTAIANTIWLVVAIATSMCVMMIIVVILLRNIRKMQDELFRMANYDLITGLPNRQFLMNYLKDIAKNAIKTKSSFALLFIDIDNFKSVNDNDGHDAGDELLRHIATYLTYIHDNAKLFRPPAGILNMSARIGGDEFITIIPGIDSNNAAQMAAKKVVDNFHSQTLDRFIEKYQVGMSIGVALFPTHTNNFHVLVKYADIAMYHAKKGGKHTYRVFDFDMDAKDSK